MIIITWATIPYYLFAFFRNFKALRGEGIGYLNLSLRSLAINFLIEPIFIFTFKLGVIGAALANLVSISYLGLNSWSRLRGEVLPIKIDLFAVRDYLKYSSALIGSKLSEDIGGILITLVISLFGLEALGLWGIGEVILGITWAITNTLRDVITAEAKRVSLRELMERSWIISGLVGALLVILLAIALPPLFLENVSEVRALRTILLAIALSFPLSSMIAISVGYIRGIGKVKVSLALDFSRETLLRPILTAITFLVLSLSLSQGALAVDKMSLMSGGLSVSLVLTEALSAWIVAVILKKILSRDMVNKALRDFLFLILLLIPHLGTFFRSFIGNLLRSLIRIELYPLRAVGGALG